MPLLHAPYLKLLEEELIKAQGCTEPISLAYAAAKAKALLNEDLKTISIACSGSLIKNISCVCVPNTGHLIGIEASIIAGIVGGNAELGLEVLSTLDDKDRIAIKAMLKTHPIAIDVLDSPLNLHFILKLESIHHCVEIEIKNIHTHIVRITKDGVDLFLSDDQDTLYSGVFANRDYLKVSGIVDFVNTVAINDLKPLLTPQVTYNMAIAKEGLAGDYGVSIGRAMLKHDTSLYGKLKAYTAAASEARMCGSDLSVITNSGSGNQGIAASIPVILYAQEKKLPEESMLRALALSNLLTIYQKTSIGRLSAFCGAVCACCSSGAALTYLEGGTVDQIKMTIINALADVSGLLCDGAKASCGSKIATGLEAAFIGHFLAMEEKTYKPYTGLLRKDVDDTILAIGRIANEGMKATDKVILDMLMNQNK